MICKKCDSFLIDGNDNCGINCNCKKYIYYIVDDDTQHDNKTEMETKYFDTGYFKAADLSHVAELIARDDFNDDSDPNYDYYIFVAEYKDTKVTTITTCYSVSIEKVFEFEGKLLL